jgi:hypothetical protein
MIWPRPCVKRTNGGVGMLVRNVFNIYSSSVDFRVYIHHSSYRTFIHNTHVCTVSEFQFNVFKKHIFI